MTLRPSLLTVLLIVVLSFAACRGAASPARTTAPTQTAAPTLASTATQVPAPSASATPAAQAESSVYVGDIVDPPVHLQDFNLPSSTGESMRLSDLDGQWRLMFFGYLHCPDFCPITLSEYKRVKAMLGDSAESVEFVYISVDGVRDTPDALQRYLANFDSSFIGFSGDDETLASIQPDYGFYYRRRFDTGTRAEYVIDHSTRSYLVDRDGYLRATFTYDIRPEQVAQAIDWYLQQEGASAS